MSDMRILVVIISLCALAFCAETHLLDAMQTELDRSTGTLADSGAAPLYFLGYEIMEKSGQNMSAQFGSISDYGVDYPRRILDVDLRVGDYKLDNTHPLSERDWFAYLRDFGMSSAIPIDGSPETIRHYIWLVTDRKFQHAQEDYIKVQGDVAVKVEKEDTSADFSRAEPEVYIGEIEHIAIDSAEWASKLKAYSARFSGNDFLLDSRVSLNVDNLDKFIVNSEGTRLQFSEPRIYLSIYASVKADDGMQLYLYDSYMGDSFDDLPSDDEIYADIDLMLEDLRTLKDAPTVEPYTCPAILRNRAAGVFFHEIFGHRLEGHRQEIEDEGQTFVKKVGQSVLPDFLSVYDDPSLSEFEGNFLNGHYMFDDEGVRAQRADVVRDGILSDFLMSRNPIEGFDKSNGHGRRSSGNDVVARQGNLIVESSKTVPFDELRTTLIDKCKEQGKDWGLIFDDISGGFTMTMRYLPQSYKVIPLKVWRVYTDGRPDELVRGVDIVGTPLTSFSMISATGDDPYIFNGMCGAESGRVPVSAVSPSVLVDQIEVEKKYKGTDKPPILPAPKSVVK